MGFRHVIYSLLLLYAGSTIADTPIVGHDLWISFNEASRSVAIRDRVDLSSLDADARASLTTLSIAPDWRVTGIAFDGDSADPTEHVVDGVIALPRHANQFTIAYDGAIDERQWPYVIWLPGDGWHPESPGLRHRFSIAVEAPSHWRVLTQADPVAETGDARHRFAIAHPQQGIYLVAGPWRSYQKSDDGFRAGVLLLQDDAGLADTYLSAAIAGMRRYAEVIGPYPYHAFTLVENRRQTGWGMPGFTLLGSRVIRLPFIVDTSFQHEILHNWWGNGVFVDLSDGNWSEGLTTYLSDHLLRERRGEGARYRLDTLIDWHDFASRGNDFPLAAFAGRHDRATQAVGYGKGMFFFHMLRAEMGDDRFLDALRAFYRTYRYRHAGFDDMRETFERSCDCSLDGFFSQWLERKGAPTLDMVDADVFEADDGHAVSFRLRQTGEPWRLRIPARVTGVGGTVVETSVRLDGEFGSYEVLLGEPVARLDVDPDHDLFRRLVEGEQPLTFSRVFGAGTARVVPLDEAFEAAAAALAAHASGWRVSRNAPDAAGGAVILLGNDNASARRWFGGLEGDRLRIDQDSIVIDGEKFDRTENEVVALVAGSLDAPVMWVAASEGEGVVDLVRRLSHYGRASYAILPLDGGVAVKRGQWPVERTSLTRVFAHGLELESGDEETPLF